MKLWRVKQPGCCRNLLNCWYRKTYSSRDRCSPPALPLSYNGYCAVLVRQKTWFNSMLRHQMMDHIMSFKLVSSIFTFIAVVLVFFGLLIPTMVSSTSSTLVILGFILAFFTIVTLIGLGNQIWKNFNKTPDNKSSR